MKKIVALLGSLALGVVLFLPFACGSYGPSAPTKMEEPTGTPTSVTTATVTSTPTSGVDWNTATVYHSVGATGQAYVYLAVDGQAVSTAGVTLSGTFTGSPIALTSDGTVYPIGDKNYDLYQAFGVQYEPGETYILTTVTTAGTAAATLTAPGGITTAPLDAHGAVTQASWGTAGNDDLVYVDETSPSSLTTFNSGNTSSPLSIPGSAYPGGAGSVYAVNALINESLYTVPGATTGSSFQIYETYSKTVTWN